MGEEDIEEHVQGHTMMEPREVLGYFGHIWTLRVRQAAWKSLPHTTPGKAAPSLW